MDPDRARDLWKTRQAATFAEAEGISAEDAARYLRFAQFDENAARLSLRKTLYPAFPERTLRFAEHPAKGIELLAEHLGEHHGFSENELLNIHTESDRLPERDRTLLLLHEWWQYAAKQGMDIALSLPEITDHFARLSADELNLQDFAHLIQQTRAKLLAVLGGQPKAGQRFSWEAWMYPDLGAALGQIREAKEDFYQALYEWAWERKAQFPS